MRKAIEIKDNGSNKEAYLNKEKLLRYTEQSDAEFVSLKTEYLAKIQKNIKQRFRKEDSRLFTDLSLVLEPSVVSISSQKETEDALEKVGIPYGEDKKVQVIHGDLQEEGVREETKEVQKLLD